VESSVGITALTVVSTGIHATRTAMADNIAAITAVTTIPVSGKDACHSKNDNAPKLRCRGNT